MLHWDNGIIMPVWFSFPGKIKHFIIVIGTNILYGKHPSNYLSLFPLKPEIHMSASSHTTSFKKGRWKETAVLSGQRYLSGVVAHGGSWPHFYYRCLLLMISSKPILKAPAAPNLSLSRFMAVRTDFSKRKKKVNGHRHAYAKVQWGSLHLIKACSEPQNM